MTIAFILNGEDVTVDTEPDRRLIDILRSDFKLYGAKCGCLSGVCGACAVILNGSVSSACMVPAFRVRGSEVITIEGFSLTNDYNDIIRGFNLHDVENCGFCGAAKILLTETLLAEKELPQRDEILSAFNSVRCRCTLGQNLADAVIAAAKIRQRRRGERKR
ncbi:MAG: 2Fe-2S iron-sulfur cluster binding domain-containing protein [Spirochaetaceae bacterium]|jgi:carbon-monoxide dehydrogenase small subunit|nr:2Fe-2S iron-sulfur cluster binding domain-containing protein [Spirochaetaceae bacterium]